MGFLHKCRVFCNKVKGRSKAERKTQLDVLDNGSKNSLKSKNSINNNINDGSKRSNDQRLAEIHNKRSCRADVTCDSRDGEGYFRHRLNQRRMGVCEEILKRERK